MVWFLSLSQCWLLVGSGAAATAGRPALGCSRIPALPSAPCSLTWRACWAAALLPTVLPRAVQHRFLPAAPGCHECRLSTALQPVALHFLWQTGSTDERPWSDCPAKSTEKRGEVFTPGFCRSLAELRPSLLPHTLPFGFHFCFLKNLCSLQGVGMWK